jgi:excisionase family DNA binding protein
MTNVAQQPTHPEPRLNWRSTLLECDEIAKQFGLSKQAIYNYANQGILPCVRIGRHIRFRLEDIEAFIASGGKALDGGWKKEGEK